MYNSMIFRFTEVLQQNFRTFLSPEKDPFHHLQSLQILIPHPQATFCLHRFTYSEISFKWSRWHVASVSAFFPLAYNVPRLALFWHESLLLSFLQQTNILFYGHFTFVNPFTWILFSLMVIMKNAIIQFTYENLWGHILCFHQVPSNGNLGHMLNFLRKCHTTFQSGYTICIVTHSV